MTPYTLNGKRILVVEVPEGAKNFTQIQSHSYYNSPRIEHSVGGFNLPREGSWQLLGIASEISDSEWAEIVEKNGTGYWDYTIIENDTDMLKRTVWAYATATDSGLSWLTSIGADKDKVVLLIEK